jgi:hypothetical protein
MSMATVQLDAGGLLLAKAKVDTDATEQIVARTYRHPALGRPVIRLASDRLGQAEDLAMEFLGFEAPTVSSPIALQQRRSLGFAAWALINDPGNARYALDLVKRMKAAARQARSKPGHAWEAYTEMAKDLGRSARHFLPPFWEEAGRTFKDLGNQTYAGRALNKSLEAERVHALESDRAPSRRCFGIPPVGLPLRQRAVRLRQRFANSLFAARSVCDLSRPVCAADARRHVALGHAAEGFHQAGEGGGARWRPGTGKVAGRSD